jgi:sec-independent protein translocase protein TatA
MQALLMFILGFSMPGGFEWVIILIVVLLVFGGKKIPELMKGVGKGIKGFKDGIKGLEDEIKSDDSKNEK